MIYKTVIIVFLLASIFCVGCNYSPSHDVYTKVPKQSHLTKDVFLNSTQIISYESDIILAYNTCPNCWERNDTHLLFYDENLNLSASTFFSSGKVENIKNGIISGFLNKDRFERSSNYRNDLPPKYSLKLQEWEGGSGRQSNKIIQRILLDTAALIVKIIVKECTNDDYIGLGVIEGRVRIDSTYLSKFTKLDSITCKVSDILFDKEETLSIEVYSPNNYLTDDIMIVKDKFILSQFYNQLWEKIISSHKSKR